MTRRLLVGPFNRVEGDLEVRLDVADGAVRAAQVSAPMFRGFEQMLLGKAALDALVVVPRICGICSVAQSAAAAAALADASGVQAPPNGRLASRLVLATENLADHLTHFYLFFMPDFAREAYRARPWFDAVHARFAATTGSATRDALPARMEFMQAMGLLAGKWPHTLSLQPGGSTQPVQASQRLRLITLLGSLRRWLERAVFGDALEAIAALRDARALADWCDARAPDASDFRLFLAVSQDLRLDALGRGGRHFLAGASHDGPDGALFAGGAWLDGQLQPLQPHAITEDSSHAWLRADPPVRAPAEGDTWPAIDRDQAYTWSKAPRWHGQVMETGALARQVVHGHPLLRDLARDGSHVAARVVARLLELALVVPAMERWARALAPGEPFCLPAELPGDAQAVGLVEAARGLLGHWVALRDGRIERYQIVAPTTWNFSPRDAAGTPGALEQALVGTPVGEGERTPLAVQHVVRSFDPCMSCTVH